MLRLCPICESIETFDQKAIDLATSQEIGAYISASCGHIFYGSIEGSKFSLIAIADKASLCKNYKVSENAANDIIEMLNSIVLTSEYLRLASIHIDISYLQQAKDAIDKVIKAKLDMDKGEQAIKRLH